MAFFRNGYEYHHPHHDPIGFPINRNQAGNSGIDGYGTLGDCSITAEDPRYKGYEGYYWPASTRANNTMASSLSVATPSLPYDYGTYNKGPRSSRGGLSPGWENVSGNIFKIVKSGTSTSWANGVYIYSRSSITHYKHAYTRFRAYFFVQAGPTSLQIGHLDSQSSFAIGGYQEWKYVDFVFGTSDVMKPDFLMSLGPTSGGSTREVWMAFPTIEGTTRKAMAQDDEQHGNNVQFLGVSNY